MKVLMLLEGEFPPDERVEKEALTLLDAGYEVEIFALSFTKNTHVEDYKGIKVYSTLVPKLVFKFFPALLVFPLYYWFRKQQYRKIVNKFDYGFIHVHDLPMSRMGFWLKKKCRAKLICDQHEFYSNWIGRTAHMQTVAGRIILLFSRWNRYERKYLNRADTVITVSENLREIYLKTYGLSEEKIISVPNTPLEKELENLPPDLGLKEKYKDRFVLFYGGMIDILRGIDLIIKALPLIRKDIPGVLVVLAGRIRRGSNPLAVARAYGVEDLVEFVGFLSPEKLRAYIDASSVCFATLPADSIEINNTIITKIYQYAAARKPILTGKAEMMKQFVARYNLGMSVDEKDPQKIAEIILTMRKRLDTFTFNVPAEEMFWEYTSLPLVSSYKRLL
jgi:glycosyltransferase involved in cell wall biosynthesis